MSGSGDEPSPSQARRVRRRDLPRRRKSCTIDSKPMVRDSSGSASGGAPLPPAPSGPERDRIRDWVRLLRWPVAAVLVAGLLALVAWRLIAGLERAGRAAANLPGAAAERIGALARDLLTGNVTESFLAAIPTVAPHAGGNLEVAVAESVESLTRSDERRAFWDLVDLGTTTVEIRVPVTYR
ncbi:MAG: hypothetical protein KBF21_17955, partial [Thermoanaerobaculia bacterium]|nr:hypothetical protein [Thermoanaerobaculia bacterium]